MLFTVMAAAGCAESLPAPAYQLPDGFCYVHDVIEDVVLDIRYAGEHNFVGEPIDGYEAPYAILSVKAALCGNERGSGGCTEKSG